MEEFTLALTLVDLIPVLTFGGAVLLLAERLKSPLFFIGAVLSLLAGLCKVLWKLILGTTKRDVKWLNRCFLPMQAGGWLVMLAGIALNVNKLSFSAIISSVFALPQGIFFLLWAVGMGAMVWYKKTRFERYSAKANWTAEIINSLAQGCLFAAVLLALC